MSIRTQIRLPQITGSLGTETGQISDQLTSNTATGSINAGDLTTVLSHMASAIKKIHGASSFSEQSAGTFSQTLNITGALTASAGLNIGGDVDFQSDVSISGDLIPGSGVEELGKSGAEFAAVHANQVIATGLTGSLKDTSLSNTQVIFANSNNTLAGSSDLTWSGTGLTLGTGINLTVGGNLTVSGETVTLNTTNAVIQDRMILLHKGNSVNASDPNGTSAIAFLSGSNTTDQSTIIGTITNDVIGVSRMDAQGGIATPNFSNLIAFRAGKLEVDGDANYFDVISSDLTATAAANFKIDAASGITLDADSGTISIQDDGNNAGSLVHDAASKVFKLASANNGTSDLTIMLASQTGVTAIADAGGNHDPLFISGSASNTLHLGMSGNTDGIPAWDQAGYLKLDKNDFTILSSSYGLRIDSGASASRLSMKSNSEYTFTIQAPGSLASGYTAIFPTNANIAVGKVLKVNQSLGGGEWQLEWASESAASYTKGVKTISGATINAGTGISMSSVNYGSAPSSLQLAYGNLDVYVNGAMMISGSESDRSNSNVDYTVSGAQELKFSFNIEDGDVISVFARS